MIEIPLAIAICTVVSIVWYYMSKFIAQGFYSREDMTIPIFLAGLIVLIICCSIAAIVMIVWWY